MSKFIIMKKNTIVLIFIVIILLGVTIYFSTINSIKLSQTTLNNLSNLHNGEYFDFDCDGSLDNISIISNNSTYSIKIKTSTKELLLKSNEFNYELLDVTTYCPLRIKYLDLTRDNIPEIIIYGLKNNIPTFYIYKWIDDGFVEVFFSQKNIFGILDYNNSKTPKILQTLSNSGDLGTDGYLFKNNTVKNITYSNPTIPSLGIIQKFIDLVQVEYEIDETPGIFTPYIPSEELGLLWNLDKGVYHYDFQYGHFFDSTWNTVGNPTTIYWTLSFKRSNFSSSNTEDTELLLSIKCELDELGEFKISSIKKL